MASVELAEVEYRLLKSDPADRRVTDALDDLFSGDGTIYLIVGFFTFNGYRSIRDDIENFLDRKPENHLNLVVGPASDQFSPRIADDLWDMDNGDQVDIYSYRRGLHAKLYLRDGPETHVILGSANLTQVGFRYNLELGIELISEDRDHPHVQPFIDWANELIDDANRMRRRDLYMPVQVWNSLVNWTNKGRLLPRRHVAKRIGPIVILLITVAVLARFL